jgi:hypothetical protein
MRDDRTQAAGPFAPNDLAPGAPAAKGSMLQHGKLIDFIHRNYAHDEHGQWFFQNGPQRVYVELENTPYVWRLQPDGRVLAHTGADAGGVSRCIVDEAGRLYLETPLGVGLVHTSDMGQAADRVESGQWAPETVAAASIPSSWLFVRSPQRRHESAKAP